MKALIIITVVIITLIAGVIVSGHAIDNVQAYNTTHQASYIK